jgi:hypothetical protein
LVASEEDTEAEKDEEEFWGCQGATMAVRGGGSLEVMPLDQYAALSPQMKRRGIIWEGAGNPYPTPL